jgi:O-antigen/teichoic acid export membrane protein
MATNRLRYLQALVANYVALASATLYSLFAIRWSVDYLSKDQFGVWNLVVQIALYLSLMDFGLSGTLSRFIIDYRHRDEQSFADGFRIGVTLFAAMGILMLLASTAMGFLGTGLLADANPLRQVEFRNLLIGQGCVLLASFLARGIASPLLAANLQHMIAFGTVVSSLVSMAALLIALRAGVGVYSFLIAGGFGVLSSGLFLFAVIVRRDLFPKLRGRFDRVKLREMTSFAKDGFIWLLGAQVLGLLPLLVLTKMFGLGDVADFSGAMKMTMLAVAIGSKLTELAIVPLSTLQFKGEHEALERRFSQLLNVTATASVIFGAFVIAGNPAFLALWTKGVLHWDHLDNLFLGLWLASSGIFRCINTYAYTEKAVRIIRFAPMLEVLFFVSLLAVLRGQIGRTSVPAAMFGANVLAALCVFPHYFRRRGRSLRVLWDSWKLPLSLGSCLIALILVVRESVRWSGEWIDLSVSLGLSAVGSLVILVLATNRDVRAQALGGFLAWFPKRGIDVASNQGRK